MATQQHIITLYTFFFHSEPLSVIKIQGDASSRQYFRVTGAAGSFIACYDPAFSGATAEQYNFLVMRKLLSDHNISVPAIITVDEQNGLLLLEDCGDLLLQNVFGTADEPTIPDRYREILDLLVQLQSIRGDEKTLPFCLSFDSEKLMFEFDFFIEHAVQNYFAPHFNQCSISALRREFEAIAKILVQPRHFVLNHRDFHSRNILIHHNKPVIIDFQDARMGLPQYDAVSLIKDSYIKLDSTLVEELKTYHYNALCRRNISTMSFDEYLYFFDIMAFQRNIKAIGTFCYQTTVKKNSTFEHSIAPTLAYLPDYIAAQSELKVAGKLLQPLLDGVVA